MPTWTYEARDAGGHLVRGERDAPDRQSALESLRAQGLFLTRLEARTPGARAAATTTATAPTSPVATGGRPPQSPPPSTSSPSSPQPPLHPRAPQVRPASPTRAESPTLGEPLRPRIAPNGGGNGVAPYEPAPQTAGSYVAAQAAPDTGSTTRAIPPIGQSATGFIPPQPLLQASNKDLSVFFGQIAALLHAGTSIGAALMTMADGPIPPVLRKAATQLGRSVMSGGSVSVGMEAFPGLFSPLVIGIVRAGELGGFLETAFTRLARYAERDYELETSVKRETWYPKLLVLCSIFIPAAVPLFLQGGGAFMRQVLPPLVVIGLLFVLRFMWKKASPFWKPLEEVRRPLDELKLYIPLVSKIARGLASAKFCRAMGALYSAGVGPGEAVRLSAKACGNKAIEARALRMIPRLERGESFTACMSEVGGFNKLALQMMKIGEESGALDEQLDKAADFLEVDAETAIKQAIPVLGILVFLCIAAYIGSQIAQFWTGYYNGIFEEGEKLAK